jgi:hypothetical protein
MPGRQAAANDEGKPPAQLNPHHAPQRWLQRFDNLLANVVTRPRPNNRRQKGSRSAAR